MATDLSKITPCGSDCEQCGCFYDKGCKGCRENAQTRENDCAIYKCCEEHGAYFCGVCREFPCEFLKSRLADRDKDGLNKLKKAAYEYRNR